MAFSLFTSTYMSVHKIIQSNLTAHINRNKKEFENSIHAKHIVRIFYI